jgi:hypothetical protein
MFNFFLIDNTVSATAYAIKEIVKEEADDYFVVVLSDANIQQYRINPEDIARGNQLEHILRRYLIYYLTLFISYL